ncbi:MAG: TRAP transporter small permease subunit [Nitrososphaerales archaeon]
MDRVVLVIARLISEIGGFALTFMMFITFADVILRAGGVPIIGTYEVVSLLLALVVALSLPKVTAERAHVYMEFVLERLGRRGKLLLNSVTRILAISVFFIAGIYLIQVGKVYSATKEVTATIKIPLYPFAYIVAFSCFVQCAVLLREIVSWWRGKV